MASHIGLIHQIVPPDANFATPGFLDGGSTPGELMRVWAFDASSDEHLDFHCTLSDNYAGGGLTIRFTWAAAATSGTVEWAAAVRAYPDDAEDIDSSHSYVYNNAAADTVPSASGEFTQTEITFTDGADMDSLAAGELFTLRVFRDVSEDTATGDAYLVSVEILETGT